MDLQNIEGFDWNEANREKILKKHGVLFTECEQVFFNKPILIQRDEKHSHSETRYYALGKSLRGKKLFVVFTLREKKIRVISARGQNRKERKVYEAL